MRRMRAGYRPKASIWACAATCTRASRRSGPIQSARFGSGGFERIALEPADPRSAVHLAVELCDRLKLPGGGDPWPALRGRLLSQRTLCLIENADDAPLRTTEEQLPVYESLGDVRSRLVCLASISLNLVARGQPGDRDESRFSIPSPAPRVWTGARGIQVGEIK
ncbi:MAG: hypothetical protein ACREWE_00030 [Gammaproteobacteria bacterium]